MKNFYFPTILKGQKEILDLEQVANTDDKVTENHDNVHKTKIEDLLLSYIHDGSCILYSKL